MSAWCWCRALALSGTILAIRVPAQAETGNMEGRVFHGQDTPLPGVRITVKNVVTGQEFGTVSKEAGAYRIDGLGEGLYDVTAEMAGFVTEVRHGVTVSAGPTAALDITMRLLTLEELTKIEVSSASKIEQRALEAPGVVSVITREQVDRYGWVSLNDVLYKLPGFGPAQDYDRHTVSFRGFFEGWNNNHLLHLVDGIPFNDNLYGTAYTWEITPLFMGRTIEVLRGPFSALYGSNAVYGVVQVNTISASDVESHGEGQVRVGDDGVRIYEALAGLGKEKTVSAVLGFNSYETDGNEYRSHDGSGRQDAQGGLLTFLTNDRRSSRYFWAKLEGGKGFEGFALQYHDQYWKFQTGHGWLWWIPDFREAMEDTRRVLSLSFRSPRPGRVSQEHVVRYQRHLIDWNTRYYSNDAFDGAYPAGMWEYLATKAEDVLLRTQFSVKVPHDSTLLLGAEMDRFSYRGDTEHNSNVDVDDAGGGYPPFPDNRTTALGPWLDTIAKEPITNFGLYGQYSTRGRLSQYLNLTVGVRYDRTAFDYRDIRLANGPGAKKSFSRLSPRIAAVILPSDHLSIKLLAGRAFRSPSPTEMAGAHTFSLASNIDQLKPEASATYELATDWIVNAYANLRTNIFITRFENQIAYSAANFNLSTNVYTLTSGGLEAELLLARGGLSAFLNYSYARRLSETIIDTTIAPSPDRLTWDPAHKLNFGLTHTAQTWSMGLSGHLQGAVGRRTSDMGVQRLPLNVVSLDVDRFRPRSLKGWFTLDGKAAYRLREDLVLAVTATNLTSTRSNTLVKVLPFPFDYQGEGRRVQVSLKLGF